MKLMYGDLYSDENFNNYDFVGFTANSVVKVDGSLVMGAGSAKAVRDKWKGIDKVFGSLVLEKGDRYFIVVDKVSKIFALQTKMHYKDKSPIGLVKKSLAVLKRSAEMYPDKLFAVPFPGISNGGLDREILINVVSTLPDNVHVWEKL